MNWVLLFGAIAVGGLIMVVSYAVWLWHKASDLFSELEMLGERLAELGELLNQIQPVVPSDLEEKRLEALR
ncbi:MAG TPA: hypothetical protein DCM67_09355 [Propionibacteriaceae bacterium]|jgi:hypothetical protein|nr:hypothetical protein [Propionibacteriaceae bacterium]HML51500.1 hypothetical protein [Propionicimonas sp.]